MTDTFAQALPIPEEGENDDNDKDPSPRFFGRLHCSVLRNIGKDVLAIVGIVIVRQDHISDL